MESKILKILAALGIPGVALGIFYLLLRNFEFRFETIDGRSATFIVVLFLIIVGSIVFYALHKWAPKNEKHQRNSGDIEPSKCVTPDDNHNDDSFDKANKQTIESIVKDSSTEISDPKNVIPPPVFVLDWPHARIESEDLKAWLSESSFRAEKSLSPLLHIELSPKSLYLSKLDSKSDIGRSEKVEVLREVDRYDMVENNLEAALNLIVDDALRRKVGWKMIMCLEDMETAVHELLLPSVEGIRVKLANDKAKLSTDLYVDSIWFQEHFGVELSKYSESTLSVMDTNYKQWEIFDLEFSFVRRVLGAVLRMSVLINRNPLECAHELNLNNWVLTGD